MINRLLATRLSARDYSGVILAFFALSIMMLLVLPLPPWVLDPLVAFNLGVGVLLLFFVLYIETPLAFSTFPSVLLFTTLFRIALNVATTRQILLKGDAGHIIETFGKFVLGGNLIVGLVVFFIITVVQLIVISKGAERVAEVGARFTLDAMPGKQMAIDADVKAGLITQQEAVAERFKLGQESQLFGAMDGAMKFVKGDAIAGIVIVLINLIGGMAVGVIMGGLSLADASLKYAILAIGDGLVSQIPALFITIAAGILVTRTTPDKASDLGSQISNQLSLQPKAMMLTAVVVTMFAAVPGFPAWAFIGLGAIAAFLGYRTLNKQRTTQANLASGSLPNAPAEGDRRPVVWTNVVHAPYSTIALEASISLITRFRLSDLDREILRVRRTYKDNLGLPWPGLSLRVRENLPDNTYRLTVLEAPFVTQTMPANLTSEQITQAIGDELMTAIYIHAKDLLGTQETKRMLSKLEAQYPDLCREALNLLPLPKLADLLAGLVDDGVPIRDLRGVLEVILDNPEDITEGGMALHRSARIGLRRLIIGSCLDANNALHVIQLEPDAEVFMQDSKEPDAKGLAQFVWSDEVLQNLSNAMQLRLDERQQQNQGLQNPEDDYRAQKVNQLISPVLAVLVVRYDIRESLAFHLNKVKRLKRQLRVIAYSETFAGTNYVYMNKVSMAELRATDLAAV